MIKKGTLFVLQKAIHHALALDPSSEERILALNGKVLEMIIMPLQVRFLCHL